MMFQKTGVHCIVDGQYGSTGKGALAAWLAEHAAHRDAPYFAGSIYSGGPNSGHTSYFRGTKIVLKQLPTFAVHMYLHGYNTPIYLSAGAVIDPEILQQEAHAYPGIPISVHPNAAIVTPADKEAEKTGSIAAVAGTRSGTGAAIARKVMRDPSAIAGNSLGYLAPNISITQHRIKPEQHAYMMEVAQGFDLGINSKFYPKVTSRECTVAQGLADARISPKHLAEVYMAIRTFPIRVGNVDGHSSGNWYSDQREISWESIGQKPELTTVTKRERRIATFSADQFYAACLANTPDYVFVSHMDYLSEKDQQDFHNMLTQIQDSLMMPFSFLFSFGPTTKHVWPYLGRMQEDLIRED